MYTVKSAAHGTAAGLQGDCQYRVTDSATEFYTDDDDDDDGDDDGGLQTNLDVPSHNPAYSTTNQGKHM